MCRGGRLEWLLGGAVGGRGVGEVLLLLGVVGVRVALGRDVLAVADVLKHSPEWSASGGRKSNSTSAAHLVASRAVALLGLGVLVCESARVSGVSLEGQTNRALGRAARVQMIQKEWM